MSGVDKLEIEVAPGEEKFLPFMENLDQQFEATGRSIYRARNELKVFQYDGHEMVVKSFAKPGGLKAFVYGRFRLSKAKRSYRNSLRLRELHIDVPRPIGFIEHYQGWTLGQSFFTSYYWSSAATIRETFLDKESEHRTEILKAFGKYIWSLHQRQILHRDLSPGNVLVVSQGSQWSFGLVDVNRVDFCALSFKTRMNNFSMLWASEEDLRVIIHSYCNESNDEPTESMKRALFFSRRQVARAERKERLKIALGIH